MASVPAVSNTTAFDFDFDFSNDIVALQEQIETCRVRESQVDQNISDLLRKYADIPRQLNVVFGRLKTRLTLAESDASHLSSLLSATSILAENVSGKVRDLDLAKTRVVDCMQRVEDALDLRLCTEGIRSAMANEDYEQAAGHVHRFLMLDKAILGLSADKPENEVGDETTAPSMDRQFEMMRDAERELKRIVEEKFDEALRDSDLASMERFFKLFPLLNQHQLGLEKFGSYLKSKIAGTADVNYKIMIAGGREDNRANVLFADTLTLLLEGVARVLEIHQPLVESYYGPDKLLILAEILQQQCDLEAAKIFDHFVRVRQYDKKAAAVEMSARTTAKQSTTQLVKVDPLELDVLLSEVTLLQTRVELYFRFLRRRIEPNLQALAEESDANKQAKREKLRRFEQLVRYSSLSRRMQELLGQYIAMEEYYMRETIVKAIKMDTKDSAEGAGGGQASLTSSMVDDVFFIIRKSVRRALSSSNIDCVCAMLNNACALLETDYMQVLRQRVKQGYPAAGSFAEAYTTAAAAYATVLQQGKIPGSSGVDSADKAREEFLTALNNADSSADFVRTLKETLAADVKKLLGKLSEQEAAKLDSCLSQMDDISAKFNTLTKSAVDALTTAAVKPRVKASAETFLDHTHTPSEAEFAEFESADPFIEHIITNLDNVLTTFRRLLTEQSYEHLVELTAAETARQMEKVVLKATYNRLGGLLFDRQLRELTNYLTSLAGWSLREKFARLSQIAQLLNAETVQEAKEYYQAGGGSTRSLTSNEIRQMLALRIDLPGDEIRKLKL